MDTMVYLIFRQIQLAKWWVNPHKWDQNGELNHENHGVNLVNIVQTGFKPTITKHHQSFFGNIKRTDRRTSEPLFLTQRCLRFSAQGVGQRTAGHDGHHWHVTFLGLKVCWWWILTDIGSIMMEHFTIWIIYWWYKLDSCALWWELFEIYHSWEHDDDIVLVEDTLGCRLGKFG